MKNFNVIFYLIIALFFSNNMAFASTTINEITNDQNYSVKTLEYSLDSSNNTPLFKINSVSFIDDYAEPPKLKASHGAARFYYGYQILTILPARFFSTIAYAINPDSEMPYSSPFTRYTGKKSKLVLVKELGKSFFDLVVDFFKAGYELTIGALIGLITHPIDTLCGIPRLLLALIVHTFVAGYLFLSSLWVLISSIF